jgi:MFS family permease
VWINFGAQVFSNFLFSRLVDRVGFRKLVLPAAMMTLGGLVLFAASPILFPDALYYGMSAATFIFAFSSGIYEVTLSPIHALATVRWGARFAKTGERTIEFEISYLLEKADGDWKILSYISRSDQNEEMKKEGLL